MAFSFIFLVYMSVGISQSRHPSQNKYLSDKQYIDISDTKLIFMRDRLVLDGYIVTTPVETWNLAAWLCPKVRKPTY